MGASPVEPSGACTHPASSGRAGSRGCPASMPCITPSVHGVNYTPFGTICAPYAGEREAVNERSDQELRRTENATGSRPCQTCRIDPRAETSGIPRHPGGSVREKSRELSDQHVSRGTQPPGRPRPCVSGLALAPRCPVPCGHGRDEPLDAHGRRRRARVALMNGSGLASCRSGATRGCISHGVNGNGKLRIFGNRILLSSGMRWSLRVGVGGSELVGLWATGWAPSSSSGAGVTLPTHPVRGPPSLRFENGRMLGLNPKWTAAQEDCRHDCAGEKS